jgi:hypothetical protein
MKIRASSISKIMASSGKSSLPVGAKTYIKDLAKQDFYNYKTVIVSKYLDKGILCEDESIELLNSVLFTSYKKNSDRKASGFITGECDIFHNGVIRDVKTCWSLETFPAFIEDAEAGIKKSGYDWQVRAYMHLWDANEAYIDYILIDTPSHLLTQWDAIDIHEVSHIPPEKRVTSVKVERDMELEEQMLDRVEMCKEFYDECILELENK